VESVPTNTPADLVWQADDQGAWRLLWNGEVFRGGMRDPELYFLTEEAINRLFSDKLSRWLQIHASVAVAPDGGAWIISGAPRAGKTSLVLSLAVAGWQWTTDELALIQQEEPDRVYGLRRNWNLKQDSFAFYPETAGLPHCREFHSNYHHKLVRFIDPMRLRPASWAPSAPIAGVIFPRFDAACAQSCLSPRPPLQSTQGLLEQSVQWHPWAMPWLAGVGSDWRAYDFVYADPRQIAPLLAVLPADRPLF
jgi:hypothetical protein